MKLMLRVALLVTLLLALAGVMSAGSTLYDFTFYLNASSGTTATIEADVFSWSGNLYAGNSTQGAIGPAWWTTSFSYTASGGTDAETLSPNVNLPLGNYIALFTVSQNYADAGGPIFWAIDLNGHPNTSTSPNIQDGGFNFVNNNDNYACLNAGNWSSGCVYPQDDFADFGSSAWIAHFSNGTIDNSGYSNYSVGTFGGAFTATYGETFSLATPEPGAMILLVTGLLGFASRLRRRR